MSKIGPIKPADLIRLFEKFGFRKVRQVGAHVSMQKTGVSRPLVISIHAKELTVPVIKSNLKTAGISREDYLKAVQEL